MVTTLLFEVNYKFINPGFALRLGQNYILDTANAPWFPGFLFLLKKRDLWNQVEPACRLLFFPLLLKEKWLDQQRKQEVPACRRQSWTELLENVFFVFVHYLMQQNYFHINGFTQRKPPPPGHHCFPDVQVWGFFLHHFNSRGKRRKKLVCLQCLRKCSPSMH